MKLITLAGCVCPGGKVGVIEGFDCFLASTMSMQVINILMTSIKKNFHQYAQ